MELEPTGPLVDWIATHHRLLLELVLDGRHESGEREHAIQGFMCEVIGPSGQFRADDRDRESAMGLISGRELPNPKTQGDFHFPRDFQDAPQVSDLHAGEYSVSWSAWESADEPFGYQPLDVARDTFRVLRDGEVV